MSKIEKLLEKILAAQTDIRFTDLEKILIHAGYRDVRQKGSHHHFRKPNAPSLTIPVHNGKVKIVYVKNVLQLLDL